jgi:2-methylcitrate dehydratase PrpD
VDVEQIEEVLIFVPAAAVPIVLEPAAAKVSPRTPYEAKFSLQYSLAALLARGRLTLGDYSEQAIADKRVLGLASRVSYAIRDFPSYPGAFPGAVEIRLSCGETLSAEEPIQIGDHRNPLPDAALIEKFHANAGLALDPSSVALLRDRLLSLERQRDLGEVLAPLREAAGEPLVPR